MNNLVSLTTTFFTISCGVLIVSIGHASCTWPNKRVGLVFNEKTHCFQGYNQGYRKTSNNYINNYMIINHQKIF